MNIEELIQEKLRHIFNDDNIVFDKSNFAGGMTNYNYIMNIHGTEYVIRKPGAMTNEMIDRKIEAVNNSIASEFGINSDCVYFDHDSGIKISVFIKNSKNIAFSNPCSPVNVSGVSRLMKKIHASPKHFPNTFDWQAELAKYEQLIRQLNGEFFFDYFLLKKQLLDFIEGNITGVVSVPCHNDTVPENFVVDENGRIYLIDWEYSGMNDACWDIAAYIIESKLTEEAICHLFSEYYGETLTGEDSMKIKCYMMAQDLLWTAWALVRHYSGDDFLDYCCIRYERFRKNIKVITSLLDYSIADMVKIP